MVSITVKQLNALQAIAFDAPQEHRLATLQALQAQGLIWIKYHGADAQPVITDRGSRVLDNAIAVRVR